MNARLLPFALALFLVSAALAAEDKGPLKPPPVDPREAHLSGLVQLSRGGENAEAYWSPDSRELIFQSSRPPYACDQIFRIPADGSGAASLVSTGKGRTTCSYFLQGGKRVLYSSTHLAGPACPPPPDRSHGYVWSIDPSYEIFTARPDGSDLARLTENQAYDAETTVCPKDGSLIFTSTRDGDLELYRMDADGRNVKRLTNAPGYDGGAFFSPDCSQIVWRASRPKEGPELDDYRRLLAQGLVRPSKLELWVANADGGDARQVTYLDAASFAPSFFPDGKRLVFSSNYGDPKGREFDLWAIDADGTHLERITWTAGFDGFPVFSPDGTRLAFASNRNGTQPGETDVFVARWVEHPATTPPAPPSPTAAAERFRDDVRWLADDAREGRGIGTAGLDQARKWLADRFAALGVEPAGSDGWFESFDVAVAVEARPGTGLSLDGAAVPADAFRPASFSASGEAAGEVVAAGYGITAPELGVDDYQGVEAKGKIVVLRHFVPERKPFTDSAVERRYGDLRYKAWNAREHGAGGVIFVDYPVSSTAESPLPALALDPVDAGGDVGIPAVTVKREVGAGLFERFVEEGHQASIKVDLERKTKPAANVLGVIRAGAADRLPGALVIGAHYDHLGHGGTGSLAPDSHEIHNGADDNASGTAALLEVARELVGQRATLRRDVYLIAFSGEEEGTLGSTAFTRHPTAGLKAADLVAMLNMDMVGRLRGNQVSILGGESAEEWKEIVPAVCERDLVRCTLSGDGYGPSDHSPFYAAGVPVLHFFTGPHEDYHKPSDDADKINAAGGARVALLVSDLATEIAARPGRPTYKSAPAPAPQGDVRSYGASLGTIPDYAGDGRPGVLLAGVRAGSAAEQGGLRRGDLLVGLGGKELRDIHDFMYVLQRAKPGEKATAVVVRDGEKVEMEVTFGGKKP